MQMETKLRVLADSAKYDVSCSSSGSSRQNKAGGLGNAHLGGICHSWTSDGRCISLLKILFSNDCAFNCAYCVNRSSNDIPRASFTPDELVALTINFYRRNYIEGLFLSSAVLQNPDYTMELLLQVVRKLRQEQHFNGYIHLKAIPGADPRLIEAAGRLVDRMSVNIELPTQQGLKLLAPQKSKKSIFSPMALIRDGIAENRQPAPGRTKAPGFVPAGQTTQLMVGATPDHDLTILRLTEGLYKHFTLKRVYFSAYVPVVSHAHLPALTAPPLLREHRLYQADWLLRFYGFSAGELLDESRPDFEADLDPKCSWALRHLEAFPVEINKADLETLLRVPGIGPTSARKIISARRVHSLDFDTLKKIGVVLKRARYFIACRGKLMSGPVLNEEQIRHVLAPQGESGLPGRSAWQQLSLFDQLPVYNQNQPTFPRQLDLPVSALPQLAIKPAGKEAAPSLSLAQGVW